MRYTHRTGCIPFHGIEEDQIEDLIHGGVRPDISLIDDDIDATTAQRIMAYLDSGGISLSLDGIFLQARESSSCIATDFSFQHCLATLSHTYRKIVLCKNCIEKPPQGDCPYLYLMSLMTDTNNLICIKCRPVEATELVYELNTGNLTLWRCQHPNFWFG